MRLIGFRRQGVGAEARFGTKLENDLSVLLCPFITADRCIFTSSS